MEGVEETMFTPEQLEKYAENPLVCPFCASANLACSSMQVELGMAWQDVRCADCGKTWQDIYHLSGVAYGTEGGEEQPLPPRKAKLWKEVPGTSYVFARCSFCEDGFAVYKEDVIGNLEDGKWLCSICRNIPKEERDRIQAIDPSLKTE